MVTSAGTSSSNQLVDDKFLPKASEGVEDSDTANNNGHEMDKSPRPDRTEQDMMEMEQSTTPPPLTRYDGN